MLKDDLKLSSSEDSDGEQVRSWNNFPKNTALIHGAALGRDLGSLAGDLWNYKMSWNVF